jgi:hypothetical protein
MTTTTIGCPPDPAPHIPDGTPAVAVLSAAAGEPHLSGTPSSLSTTPSSLSERSESKGNPATTLRLLAPLVAQGPRVGLLAPLVAQGAQVALVAQGARFRR